MEFEVKSTRIIREPSLPIERLYPYLTNEINFNQLKNELDDSFSDILSSTSFSLLEHLEKDDYDKNKMGNTLFKYLNRSCTRTTPYGCP